MKAIDIPLLVFEVLSLPLIAIKIVMIINTDPIDRDGLIACALAVVVGIYITGDVIRRLAGSSD